MEQITKSLDCGVKTANVMKLSLFPLQIRCSEIVGFVYGLRDIMISVVWRSR